MPSSIRLLPVLLFAVLVAACSRTPDTGDARKALQAELENAHLAELLAVTDVEKHNGYEDSDGRYTVEVSYSLEAMDDLEGYSNKIKGDETLSGMDRFAMIMTLSALRMEHGNFKKGDTFQRQRVLTFRDTEKGWMPIQE
ncbi:MAG: hypothetical protein MI745_04700 [Pseudomonadales bacterium]|nr:hypothetical protein [Pseudomonadales bacterium]